MFSHFRSSLIVGALAAFVLVPLLPQPADAQVSGRFRVLIPDLRPTDGSNSRFGERVAENLRGDIDLERHVAINRRDMERAAREFDLRRQDLDCITARQLAPQVDAQVVMCGDYTAEGDSYRFDVVFYTVPNGDEMRVPIHTVAQRDERGASNFILQEFEGIVERLLRIGYCGSAFNSSNWEDALNHCSQAIELAPESKNVKVALANTYRNLERHQEALELFEGLIAEDAFDDSSLQSAAWLSAQVGDTDKAFEYYSRYLDLNPGNVQVRITLAYDLGQAGNPRGAMELLRDGFEQEPDNVDLHEQFGSMAFRAALMLQAEQPQTQDSDATLNPEVAALFREAVNSLGAVLEAKGADARSQYVTNSMRALLQLGEVDEAIALGNRAAPIYPGEADIHAVLADAHNRKGNVDAAVSALDRAIQINPALTNTPRTRKGTFLLQANRMEDAAAAFRDAVAAGERSADQVATILFGHGYSNFIQNQQNIPEGIRYFEAARTFDISAELRSQIGFFHGFALFTRARVMYEQDPNSVANAQRLLPMFQQAKVQLQAGRQYGQANQAQSYAQMLQATDQFIEIQDAVIRRGR